MVLKERERERKRERKREREREGAGITKTSLKLDLPFWEQNKIEVVSKFLWYNMMTFFDLKLIF